MPQKPDWLTPEVEQEREQRMNKRKLIIIILLSITIFFTSLWTDPILFGGTWGQYVIPSAVEAICFLCGVLVGVIMK